MNYDIEKIIRKLLIKYPLFGSVINNLEFVEDYKIETAETDGEVIYFNPKFVSKLSEKEQVFLFAHEVCHVALNHIFRGEGKNGEVWNIATDAVINANLRKDGFQVIKNGVDVPEAVDFDAEELYEILLSRKTQNIKKDGKFRDGRKSEKGTPSSGKGDTEKISENEEIIPIELEETAKTMHTLWETAREKKNKKGAKTNKDSEESDGEKNKKTKGDGSGKENVKQKKQGQDTEKTDDETVGVIAKIGEKAIFKQNENIRKKKLEEFKNILVQESIGGANRQKIEVRNMKDIGVSDAVIDWRKLFIESIQRPLDWSYTNATIEDGVVTPHLEKMPSPEIEIILDTSGSINETLLKNFLRECKNILKNATIRVGCFDTRFYGFKKIIRQVDIDTMVFLGGGGTDFDVAVNAFSKNIANKVIFTDGDAKMPEKAKNITWIVFGGRQISPKGGRVIYITKQQEKSLNESELER